MGAIYAPHWDTWWSICCNLPYIVHTTDGIPQMVSLGPIPDVVNDILGITQTSSNLRYHTPFSITVRACSSCGFLMPIWCLVSPIWLSAYPRESFPRESFPREFYVSWCFDSHLTFCRTILGITRRSNYCTRFNMRPMLVPMRLFDAHLMFWMPIWCFVFPIWLSVALSLRTLIWLSVALS